MKIIKAISPLFLIVVLVSCSSFISTPAINPTKVTETSLSSVKTEIVGTLTAIPTGTFSPPMPTATYLSAPTAVLTPAPEEQVYKDPEGWYSIFFPADMKPTEKPNAFSRMGDIFETGYLPEMGYMSNVMNVCAWLANIELDPAQSVVEWGSMMSPTFESEPRCSVSSHPNAVQNIQYQIFEISAADPEHRFVYIKTNWSSFSAANGNTPIIRFSWLKPITPRQEPTLAPLSEAEISLMEKTAPLLQGASVTEYALPPCSDPSQEANLLRELPEKALPDWLINRANLPMPTKTPTVEEQLKPLGYQLKVIHEIEPHQEQLLRDGRVLFDYVFSVSNIYNYSADASPLTAFVVTTVTLDQFHSPKEFHSFLIQNDAIYPWEYSIQDPPFDPVLYQNQILWAKTNKDFTHVEVRNNNQETVASFAVYTEPSYAVNRFKAWNGHWILGARDFLIQDGEFINEKLGFEEIFNWGLINEKPVYLFRKGPRIGISYDGRILPLEYQDVARYKCCGYAANNPDIDSKGVHFFAKRNGVWYYVVVKVK